MDCSLIVFGAESLILSVKIGFRMADYQMVLICEFLDAKNFTASQVGHFLLI